jgi:hypothetical protein
MTGMRGAAGLLVRAMRRAQWVTLVILLASVPVAQARWNPRQPLAAVPCQLFPSNNVWNTDISALPVDAHSAEYVASIGAALPLHPDFGTRKIGIPYAVTASTRVTVPIVFSLYGDESDPGPYPVPPDSPVEKGSDRHVLVVQAGTCHLYELFAARRRRRGASWIAGSGAFWDLSSNALRPAGWTSADAAGLPILPGLVRYEEVANGVITHALRFTVPNTQAAYVWPARHLASSGSSASLPPMGVRFRLKSSVDLSGFSAANQVILTALKRYGMFVADNGGAWFVTGAPDPRWNDDDLHLLDGIHGADFEAVDESGLMVSPDSGQVQ